MKNLIILILLTFVFVYMSIFLIPIKFLELFSKNKLETCFDIVELTKSYVTFAKQTFKKE